MESRITNSLRYTVRKVNISLSPENSFKAPLTHFPKIPKHNKVKTRSHQMLKSKEETALVMNIGDSLDELAVSLQRFSIQKLSHQKISKSSQRRKSPPKFCDNSVNEYNINNYFRFKPSTPASLRIDFNKFKLKTRSPLLGNKLKKNGYLL